MEIYNYMKNKFELYDLILLYLDSEDNDDIENQKLLSIFQRRIRIFP